MIIDDYTNRLNFSDNNKTQLFQDLKKNIPEMKNGFREQLRKEVSKEIQGKLSSAEIQYPSTIKEEISNNPYKKKIYNASVEFESLFVNKMLKEMRKSIHKSGLIEGGYAEEIFEDMLYDEYSKMVSGNTRFGLAEQIYNQMTENS